MIAHRGNPQGWGREGRSFRETQQPPFHYFLEGAEKAICGTFLRRPFWGEWTPEPKGRLCRNCKRIYEEKRKRPGGE